MFSNGWAQGWEWVASGARNISNVPGTGVNQKTGLCTTFPGSGVRDPCTLLPYHCQQLVASFLDSAPESDTYLTIEKDGLLSLKTTSG